VIGTVLSPDDTQETFMRLRDSILALLLTLIVVVILLAFARYIYALYDIQSRRADTLERLSWNGGSAADQAIHKRLEAAIRTSTYSSLRTPQLISVRVVEQPALGYSVIADWICHTPTADGIQITFADGSTANVKFIDDYLTQHESDSNEMVLFQGAVWRDEFSAPANETKLIDVVSIAILSGDEICSDSLSVENQ